MPAATFQPAALTIARWLAVYAAIVLLPLAVIVLGRPPSPRGFWVDFGIALGFLGLAMMGAQFALTARVRWIAEDGRAGGIGITPIMSMVRTMRDRNDRIPTLLIYGSVDESSIVFRSELDELADRLDLKLLHILERPSDDWTGERGLLTEERQSRYLDDFGVDESTHYFVCGPEPMMNVVEDALRQRGIPIHRIHSERFKIV